MLDNSHLLIYFTQLQKNYLKRQNCTFFSFFNRSFTKNISTAYYCCVTITEIKEKIGTFGAKLSARGKQHVTAIDMGLNFR